MHDAGFVHRDLSTGNVLLVGGIAKIADLEYAKHKDDYSRHNVRSVSREQD